MLTSVVEHTPGSTIAGRYRLSRALAQGAMGSVWVARHLQLDVDVAIKFMAPQFAASADMRARFEREAKAAAMLKSPHAVGVYDFGVEDGSPYIVMELLEGEDLAARLARERRLSLPVMLEILTQVGKALRRAHELGLVHRDLKPANIFLARHGGETIAKVVDFGIAKSLEPVTGAQATRSGTLLGSPSYMSPEQVRSSSHVDHRTDLWSLGVIAYLCLTGRLPFPGEELGEVLVDIVIAPIPLASQLAPDLPPAVDAFFQRALARDPAQRFQSADELVAAFAALPGARGAEAPASARVAPHGTLLAPASEKPALTGLEPTVGSGTHIGALNHPHDAASATLSPSAQTRPDAALPAARGTRTPIVVVAVVVAAALGLGLLALLRAPASPEAAAPSVNPVPAAPPPASAAPPAEPSAPEPVSAPPATASPSATAPLSPTSRPAVKPGRPSPAPSRKKDDLLKHM